MLRRILRRATRYGQQILKCEPGFFAKLFVFKSVIASGYLVPAVIAFVGSFLGLALAFIIWQVVSSLRPKKSMVSEILRT